MNSKWVKSKEGKKKKEDIWTKRDPSLWKDFSKNQEEEDEELTIKGI